MNNEYTIYRLEIYKDKNDWILFADGHRIEIHELAGESIASVHFNEELPKDRLDII